MIWISIMPGATASPAAKAISPWLIDEFLESYVGWGEAAARAYRDCVERIAGGPR
jgi:hypothetical protein